MRKVYPMDPDYAFGHSAQRGARELLAKKWPDIQIVGDDLVPLGKVKDFAPYAAKIRQSGADSVITGNWGNDLYLLARAGHDSGLDVRYYVFVGNNAGTTAGLGLAGQDRVWSIFPWHINAENSSYDAYNLEYRSRYKSQGNFDYILAHRVVGMLAKAMVSVRSDDPLKVALALEGISYDGPEGRTWMRREDHQLVVPLYLGSLVRAGQPGVKFDVDGSGLGWKTVFKMEAKDVVPPIRCAMERP